MVWVTLVRHGETADTRARLYSGWRDPPLTALGRRQAAQTAAELGRLGLNYQLVVASDLRRARQTAAVVAATLGLPLELDSRLRELDMGRWSGLDYAAVLAGDPARARAWYADPERVAPPGGETLAALRHRVLACLLQWARTAVAAEGRRDSALVAVSHGGAIRTVVQAWSGKPFWELDVPLARPISLPVPLRPED